MARVFAVMRSYVEALRLRKAIPWEKRGFTLSIEFTPISAIDKIYNIRPDIVILQNGVVHVNSRDFISAAVKVNPQITIIMADYFDGEVRASDEERKHIIFVDRITEPNQLEHALECRCSRQNQLNAERSSAVSSGERNILDGFEGSAKVQMVFFLGQYLKYEAFPAALREEKILWKFSCKDDGILLATDEPIFCCSRTGELPQALTEHIAALSKKLASVIKLRCVLVSQPAAPEYLEEEYARMYQLRKYGYFCETCEIITRSTQKHRHTELDYDAADKVINSLMVAVISGDHVSALRCVEELYLGLVIRSYASSGVEFIRQRLNEYYRLLNDVIYGIDGAVLFEDGQTFKEIEKEADFVSASFSQLISSPQNQKIHKKVVGAISIVLEHYNEVESLDNVADRLGITKTYLSKVFKEDLDVNFVMFLCKIRVSKAKELMLRGTHSITEISRLVGYEDPKYFSRVFKRITGETPSQYIATISSISTAGEH